MFGNARRILGGEDALEVTPEMRLAAFRLHVRLLGATGAHIARARSLAGWYLRGVPEAAAWRERAMRLSHTAMTSFQRKRNIVPEKSGKF